MPRRKQIKKLNMKANDKETEETEETEVNEEDEKNVEMRKMKTKHN